MSLQIDDGIYYDITPDHLSQAGAELLAARIRHYWADHSAIVWCGALEQDGIWSVRSDLKNGRPRVMIDELASASPQYPYTGEGRAA